jgi:hypothetical protein
VPVPRVEPWTGERVGAVGCRHWGILAEDDGMGLIIRAESGPDIVAYWRTTKNSTLIIPTRGTVACRRRTITARAGSVTL